MTAQLFTCYDHGHRHHSDCVGCITASHRNMESIVNDRTKPQLMVGGPSHGKTVVTLYGRRHVVHGPDGTRHEYTERAWVDSMTGEAYNLWVTGNAMLGISDAQLRTMLSEVGLLAKRAPECNHSAAKDELRFTLDQVTTALKNIGYNVECGACMEIFFVGSTTALHSCSGRRAHKRRVVCAANRLKHRPDIIVHGPRHWDAVMHRNAARLSILDDGNEYGAHEWEQGFIDQKGIWMDRGEAWRVACAAGQIIQRVGGDSIDDGHLFSENLY